MGIKDMISHSRDEYVKITTKLNDKEFYDRQVELLKEKSHILFEDRETLKEWEELHVRMNYLEIKNYPLCYSFIKFKFKSFNKGSTPKPCSQTLQIFPF